MGLGERQVVFLLSQVLHLTVRLPVVQGHRRQVVKRLVYVVLYFGWKEKILKLIKGAGGGSTIPLDIQTVDFLL